MRILVTGSRNWTDREAVWRALEDVAGGEERHTLVHGDCPTGLDRMAAAEAAWRGWAVEPHPADWSKGKVAGPLRNAEMVALGADVCLAFPLGESRGTRGCMALARDAGIPVHTVESE